MTDFDFINSTSNLTFDFGLTGDFTDYNFTEISSGDSNYDFEFGSGVSIFTLFRGISNNFNSIWADPKASLLSGRFYVGRQEDLTIINHKNSQVLLEDYYSKTSKGQTESKLNAEDVVDINVTY